ncbi:MAG: hypothetical protein ACR2NM_14335, partial [Bythopirellula sp.]
SHARTRRLPAEVLYDAIYLTTGAQSTFPGVPKGTRAAALPDIGIQLPDGFLNNLGRPPRESACECERSNDLQMGPIMALINGATVGEAVADPQGIVAQLAASDLDDRQLIKRLFLQILGRPAKADEVVEATNIINRIDQQHQQLLAELERYQQELKPIIAQRKQERADLLEKKRQELADHKQSIAPQRQRLAQEREQRIDAAKQEKTAIRQSLLTNLPTWELARRNVAQWESLNPIEVETMRRNELKVRPDHSIVVSGRNGYAGSHELVAPVDLTNITGVKIEALADERLPKQGPGRANDGNFVLTEFKVSTASRSDSPVPLVRFWDFSDDTEGWHAKKGSTLTAQAGQLLIEHKEKKQSLSTSLAAPAVALALDVTTKLGRETNLRLVWQTESDPHFDAERSVSRQFSPGSETWRTYRLEFHPKSPLRKFKLEFDGGETKIPVDSIRLIQVDAAEFAPVKLLNPQADFSQAEFAVEEAIDGKLDKTNNGWAVAPQMGANHEAIFEIAEESARSGPGLIHAELVHNYTGGKHNLGRFRVSITRSPRPIDFGLPAEIAQILAINDDQRSTQQRSQLEAYYFGQDQKYIDQLKKIAAAEKPLPPDAQLERLKQRIVELRKPLAIDPKLAQLQRAAELSKHQLAEQRLTIAQDVAWALINSPEFLYNH